MNLFVGMGRLTNDPDIRYTADGKAIARYTIAIDRRGKDNLADFISCVAFDKSAEFAEKYFHKGMKILVRGHIQTGSFTNKDGNKVYTTDVIVDNQEFCESKNNDNRQRDTRPSNEPRRVDPRQDTARVNDGFMTIPDDVEDEGLPFN